MEDLCKYSPHERRKSTSYPLLLIAAKELDGMLNYFDLHHVVHLQSMSFSLLQNFVQVQTHDDIQLLLPATMLQINIIILVV